MIKELECISYKEYKELERSLSRKEMKALGNFAIEMTMPELVKDIGFFIIKSILIAVLIVSVIGFAYVPSSSMDATLKKGDVCFVTKLLGELKRGEVYIFESNEDDKLMVKRLIGKGGDHIRVEKGKLYVNGEQLEEDYLCEEMISLDSKEYIVPEEQLFFLGDNRNASYDSRYWRNPYVEERVVVARVDLCVWPLNRIGFVK